MADFTIKRNDFGTAQPVEFILEQAQRDGTGEPKRDAQGNLLYEPIDLTGAQAVHLWMRSRTWAIKTGPVEITTAAAGVCTYIPEGPDVEAEEPADFSVADSYRIEAEIIWEDGSPQTVPNDSWPTLDVVEDLGP
jgi:hypothetical protein